MSNAPGEDGVRAPRSGPRWTLEERMEEEALIPEGDDVTILTEKEE